MNKKLNTINLELKMNMFAQIIVLLFVFYTSFEKLFSKYTPNTNKLISFIILCIAFYISLQRTTYLPFLGYTVLPPTSIKDYFIPDKANIETTLQLKDIPDNTKIIYWGAKPSNEVIKTPQSAYEDFSNCGIALVKNEKAQVSFHCPSKYLIPWGKTLERHLHYRIVYSNGMLSPVQTVFVKC